MKKTEKIKLDEIKIESFVTAADNSDMLKRIGAMGSNGCDSADDACDTTVTHCGCTIVSCGCPTYYNCCTESTGHMICDAC